LERFNAWFVGAVAKLRELPEGDGAFAALMIVLPLYERLIIARLKLAGSATGDAEIRQAIGADLGLNDQDRSIFWQMFRTGFMHQGMVASGNTKWLVSHRFDELPEFRELEAGGRCVCIDPWKFADRVLGAFQADPRLITASESFPLADLFSLKRNALSPPVAE
jgi:hypothetical protein